MQSSSIRTLLLLSFAFAVIAQNSDSSPLDILSSPSTTAASTSSVSLTPQMSASSVSSVFSVLATASPQQPGTGPSAGDAGSAMGANGVDSDAGASGPDAGSITLSRGGVIAIIVVAVFVCVFGVISAVLFYLAKKRSWKIRESIRKSARRVVTALTPRRSTFPKDIQKRRRSSRGLTKIDEIPNSPRLGDDIEKGHSKMSSFELSQPPKKPKSSAGLAR